VINAERQLERVQELEDRERALYESGRTPRFQAALAEQQTVSSLDNLNNRRESKRLAVDRFKVSQGMSIDQPVVIVPSDLELPVPQTNLDLAVGSALALRLDLQTQRDSVNDARRGVANARNELLPDLDLDGSVTIPTDDSRERAGLRFEPRDSQVRAGVTLSLPLDRK
jgi:outer membrane protein TolC